MQSEENKALKNKRENFQVEIRRKQRESALQQGREKNFPKFEMNTQQNQQQQQSTPQLQQQQQQQQQPQQQQLEQNNGFQNGLTPNVVFDPQQNEIEIRIQVLQNSQDTKEIYDALDFLHQTSYYNSCQYYSKNIKLFVEKEIAQPLFNLYFNMSQFPEIQLLILKIMTNILQGTTRQTQSIIDYKHKNGISGLQLYTLLLDEFFKSQNYQGLYTITYGIANIIGTKQSYRDFLIKNDVYQKLMNILSQFDQNDEVQYSIQKNAAWALTSLTHDPPPAQHQFTLDSVQQLIQSFNSSKDHDFLADLIVAIQQIVSQHLKIQDDFEHDFSSIIQYLMQCQILEIVKKSVFNVNMPIIHAGLKIYKNLLKGELTVTKAIIQETKSAIFPRILTLADHTMRQVRIECLKIVGDLAQINSKEINELISETFVQKIIIKMQEDDKTVKKECIHVLNHIFTNLSEKQLFLLTNADLHDILQINLDFDKDQETIINCLQIVKKMLIFIEQSQTLQLGNRKNKILKILQDKGIFTQIDSLSKSHNETIYEECVSILDLLDDYEKETDDNNGLYRNEGIDLE